MLWIDYISYLLIYRKQLFFFLIFVVIVVNWLHFVSLIYRKQFNSTNVFFKLVVNWLHFVSLIYRKQFKKYDLTKPMGCELTTFRIFDISQTVFRAIIKVTRWLWIDYISYLWYIANSPSQVVIFKVAVVNWLHFVSLIYRKLSLEKWHSFSFVVNWLHFVSLIYRKQSGVR